VKDYKKFIPIPFIAVALVALIALNSNPAQDNQHYVPTTIEPEVELFPDYDEMEEIDEIEEIEEPEHEEIIPIPVTIMIDGTPTTVEAHDIFGELFFSVEDLYFALERTQTPIRYGEFFVSLIRGSHNINGRTFATLGSINSTAKLWIPWWIPFDVDKSSDCGTIIIDTNEPYISDFWRQAVEDFLFYNHPHFFTREETWIFGGWRLTDFELFDFHDGVPYITIFLTDAGSTGRLSYEFIDGEFQSLRAEVDGFHHSHLYRDDQGQIVKLTRVRRFDFDEGVGYHVYERSIIDNDEILTIRVDRADFTPSRSLIGLNYQVTDSINQRLWPNREILPDGMVVDADICAEVIDSILYFFSYPVASWRNPEGAVHNVAEIKNSLIWDSLLRVTLEYPERRSTHTFWLELCNGNGNWEVYQYHEDFFWRGWRDW